MVIAQRDFEARVASGELDTEQKRKRLLDTYVEELRSKYPEWADIHVCLVAGA
jgi:trans-aconitate methyltransferase